jgi:hypothetical protein
MLRIKRSVQAQYNTDVGYIFAQQAGAPVNTNGGIDDGDPMASLERTAPLTGFVESSDAPVGGGVAMDEKTDTPVDASMNPEVIELGEDDDTMQD